jgi:putative MATE family efflux protein
MTGTIVTSLYNIVDRIFLGRYVGEQAIAATTVAMPMMMITMAIGMLIGFGTNSQMSIKLGEKKYEEAERLLGQGIFLFLISSIALTIFTLIYIEPLLKMFGADSEIMQFARPYLSIVMIGILPHQISFGVNNFIRGEGNPRVAMVTMLIGGILNVVFDYLFIAVFGWGMEGAAWATFLGYSVSAVWVLHYYISGRSEVRLKLANFCMKWTSVKTVLLMGSPHFIMNMITSFQMSLFNNQLSTYGDNTSISIMGVIMSFNLIWIMPIIGVSQGLQPIVGYNHGAGKPERVKKAFILAVSVATVMCTIFFIVIRVFPEQIFSLFISENNPEFIIAGAQAIQRFLLMLPVVGFIILTGNYFQFTGRPKISLALTTSRQILFLIPALIILPRCYGLDGVWYTMPASDIGALAFSLFFFIREMRLLKS